MDTIQKRYGYTGQGLRVNLTTGKITKEPTFPRFKDEIGGTALGYRVFWDEVPPKTQPLDEANKIVIAPGPFSGSGALCSSRTSITTIYPTIYPMPMIASAHIGGDMAARLKQAGYDFIIIEGKSEKARDWMVRISAVFFVNAPLYISFFFQSAQCARHSRRKCFGLRRQL